MKDDKFLVSAVCPHCGANLEVSLEEEAGICKFCGSPFVTKNAIGYERKKKNLFLKIVDRIFSEDNIGMLGLFLGMILMLVVSILVLVGFEKAKENEQDRLQTAYNEAYEYYQEGEYDKALMKAEEIYMDSDYGDFIGKLEWSSKRKKLIRMIEKAKKQQEELVRQTE